MSGGHWNYVGERIRDAGEEIAEDPTVVKRWPLLSRTIRSAANWVADVEHNMDLVLSGDSGIDDDQKFTEEKMADLVEKLLDILDEGIKARKCMKEVGDASMEFFMRSD